MALQWLPLAVLATFVAMSSAFDHEKALNVVHKHMMSLSQKDNKPWHHVLDRAMAKANSSDPPADWDRNLVGEYVLDCVDLSRFTGDPDTKISVFGVYVLQPLPPRAIRAPFNQEFTYYIGDPNCAPNASDVFAKLYQEGDVEFESLDDVDKKTKSVRVTWQYSGGTFKFPKTYAQQIILDELNKNCPCGGKWEGGVYRTIKKGDCNVSPSATGPHIEFCKEIAGDYEFQRYQWGQRSTVYVNKGAFDDIDGWSPTINPINTTVRLSAIPVRGNRKPDGCNYVRYESCADEIEIVNRTCDTCDELDNHLECDGCIWREFPDEKWETCCPCFYAFATKKNDDKWRLPC